MNDWQIQPSDFEALGVRTVIIGTPDMQGRLVGRRVPAQNFEAAVADGITVCTCVWAWDIEQSLDLIESGQLSLCSVHNGIPDATLRPDLNTLRLAAWLPGVAICLADAYELGTHIPLDISPRVNLRRECERYQSAGLVPLVSTELEFYLYLNDPAQLRRDGFRNLEPSTPYSCDFGLSEGNEFEPFFQELRDDLERSGIAVEAAQSEYGHGQWEMTFRYGDPLEMADQHVLYKMAVRDAARKRGMSVTFMPAPLNGQPGSSGHIHMSVRSDTGDCLFWDEAAAHNMSGTMRSAIEGTLQHAHALTLWFAPTINSFRRFREDGVAGLGNSWGVDDRTATVRVVGESAESIRFEFRTPGADVNPYLALLGVLAAARDGVARQLPLRDAQDAGREVSEHERLPSHLADAIELFTASEFVAELLGADTKDHHAVLARHEWEAFLSAITDWDRQRYFDRI